MFNDEAGRSSAGLRMVRRGTCTGMLLGFLAAWLNGLLMGPFAAVTTGGGPDVAEAAGMVLAGATVYGLLAAPIAARVGIVCGAVGTP